MASSIVDLAVVGVMAAKGILMAPITPRLMIGLLAVVAIYCVIVDQFKVVIFRRLGIR